MIEELVENSPVLMRLAVEKVKYNFEWCLAQSYVYLKENYTGDKKPLLTCI